jgi:hypothetical protein
MPQKVRSMSKKNTIHLFDRVGILAVAQCLLTPDGAVAIDDLVAREKSDWWKRTLMASITLALSIGAESMSINWGTAGRYPQPGGDSYDLPNDITVRVQCTVVASSGERVISAVAFRTGHDVAKSMARSQARAAKKFWKELGSRSDMGGTETASPTAIAPNVSCSS